MRLLISSICKINRTLLMALSSSYSHPDTQVTAALQFSIRALVTHLFNCLCFQEFPFFTITKFPAGFLRHIGGVVTARSVKLLDKINHPGTTVHVMQAHLSKPFLVWHIIISHMKTFPRSVWLREIQLLWKSCDIYLLENSPKKIRALIG